LGQFDSALGIISSLKHSKEIQYSWYALLSKWSEAGDWYEKKNISNSLTSSERVSYINCLLHLEDWDKLLNFCLESFEFLNESELTHAVPISLTASLNLEKWGSLKSIIDQFPDIETNFYKAFFSIYKNKHEIAKEYINNKRKILDKELIALVNEGYTRSYSKIFKSQQLSE
jgi:serine/threonine-protein kinase mTOR